MALTFDSAALDVIYEATAGHPFLYRTLCSHVASNVDIDDATREITGSLVRSCLSEWNARHRSNFQEMIQHVYRYYPDEGALIDLLRASPDDFSQLAISEESSIDKLLNLGVIENIDGEYVLSAMMELVV